MKLKLKGAQTGHSLLKRKSEALTKKFRSITAKIDAQKREMGEVMRNASFSLAQVKYIAGDVGYVVRENVKTANLKVKTVTENVSGVVLPAFEAVKDGAGGKMQSSKYHNSKTDDKE